MVDRIISKMKIHIKDTAFAPSPIWIFYRLLHIVDRRFRLPAVIFQKDTTAFAVEDHLEPFMFPIYRNSVFVDIGANIGKWCEFVLKKGFEVYAFEPDPRPFEMLKELKKDYGDKFKPFLYALGDTDEVLPLNVCYFSGHNSLVKKARDYTEKTMQVPVKKLDSVFINGRIGLIKIDTEGYERQILIGATNTINRNKPRLIIEVHTPYFEEHRAICMWLQLMAYTFKTLYKKTGQPHIIADPIRRIN